MITDSGFLRVDVSLHELVLVVVELPILDERAHLGHPRVDSRIVRESTTIGTAIPPWARTTRCARKKPCATLWREQRALPPGPRRLARVLEEHGVGTHALEAVLERGPGQRRHEHRESMRRNDELVRAELEQPALLPDGDYVDRYTGCDTSLGKSAGKDARDGKATFPALLGLEQSRAAVRQLVDKAVHQLDSFSAAAEPLRELARFIGRREH